MLRGIGLCSQQISVLFDHRMTHFYFSFYDCRKSKPFFFIPLCVLVRKMHKYYLLTPDEAFGCCSLVRLFEQPKIYDTTSYNKFVWRRAWATEETKMRQKKNNHSMTKMVLWERKRDVANEIKRIFLLTLLLSFGKVSSDIYCWAFFSFFFALFFLWMVVVCLLTDIKLAHHRIKRRINFYDAEKWTSSRQ